MLDPGSREKWGQKSVGKLVGKKRIFKTKKYRNNGALSRYEDSHHLGQNGP